jgi:hypothetical protein
VQHVAVDVRQAEIAALELEGELQVVEAAAAAAAAAGC